MAKPIAMERPVWTVCFAFIWLLMAAGAVITHIALLKVNPALKGLPERLEKGFDEVLGVGTLVEESRKVKQEAENVLQDCSFQFSDCQKLSEENPVVMQHCAARSTDSTTNKAAIMASFDRGLYKIKKLGEDKYFGVEKVKSVGGRLDQVLEKLKTASDSGSCCEQAAIYCEVRNTTAIAQDDTQAVKDEISKMTNNDIVEQFNEEADLLVYLHALPYILVLSTACFASLWWTNGACLCCRGGSWLDCAGPILLQIVFWLIAFILMSVIAFVGYAVQYWLVSYKIPSGIFAGDPTVGDLLDHVQSAFPDFWKYVFDGLVEGLLWLRYAASSFVLVCIIVAIYSCAFCCCRPYAVKGNGTKAQGDAARLQESEAKEPINDSNAQAKDPINERNAQADEAELEGNAGQDPVTTM